MIVHMERGLEGLKKNFKKGRRLRLIFWITLFTGLSALCIALLAVGFYVRNNYSDTLPTEILSFDGGYASPKFFVYRFEDRADRRISEEVLVQGLFAQKERSYVHYTEFPETLVQAFVAIEDKRFYQHKGVDWYRTASAAFNSLLGLRHSYGGSTITQQLVKNLTGRSEISTKRKVQEILYALELERTLDKSEIMELYLNVIHFSDQCDGIAEAARHYFSKEASELTLAESACIAAITNRPSYYNPIRHPQNNLERRNLILSQMYAQGYITNEEYEEAVATELDLKIDAHDGGDGINSWYVDMVIEDVINDLITEYGVSRSVASRLVYAGGLRIDIAMDEQIQKTVEEHYRTSVSLPSNANGVRAQSSIIVIDAQTGDILGVAGAVGEKKGNRIQNLATQTQRPPGSVIKPLTVYAPALEKGIIDWASVYDDVPVDFGKDNKTPWPKNATGVYRGLTNVAYAVAHSTNTVAVRILEKVGLEESFRMAKEAFHLRGMVSGPGVSDCDVAALALGQLNYGVTLRDLTNAYTVFADAGVYHPWRSYYRVLDAEGKVLLSRPDAAQIVLSAENAGIMTKLLQGVVKDGTSSSVTLSDRIECAGKTGTTNADGDRWFVGYTPELICGVWCGYEYPEPLVGRNLCTTIWNDVMERLTRERDTKKEFTVPQSLVKVTYCRDSGRLLTEACQRDPRGNRAEVGWFVKGSEPKEPCQCHVLCDYDSVEGGVSHGYCPKESCTQIGLIRVERRFPIPILVSDAQYAYGGDPASIAPNPDPHQPYFAQEREHPDGRSHTKLPVNRSCQRHTAPVQESDGWEDLIKRFLPDQKRSINLHPSS